MLRYKNCNYKKNRFQNEKQRRLFRKIKTWEDKFNKAEDAEKDNNFLEAISIYQQNIDKFTNLSVHDKLKSNVNIAQCKCNAISSGQIEAENDDINIDKSYDDIIKNMFKKFELIHEEIKENNDEIHINLAYYHNAIVLLRKFENYLLGQGLKKESIRVFFKYKQLERKRMYYYRKWAYYKSWLFRVQLFGRGALNWMDEYVLGYRVKMRHIIGLTAFIWLLFGCLYYFGKMIQHTDGKPGVVEISDSFLENMYYSLAVLTSVGSEVLAPKAGVFSRLVESIEGIAGLFIFGIIVSYFSKRIR